MQDQDQNQEQQPLLPEDEPTSENSRPPASDTQSSERAAPPRSTPTPLSTPPPITPMAPPPALRDPARSGRTGCLGTGLMIVGGVSLLFLILIFSLVMIGVVGSLAGGFPSVSDTQRFEEEVLHQVPRVSNKIAVIEAHGLISYSSNQPGGNAGLLGAQISQAMADPDVVAVVLDINSGGGEITAVDEVHNSLRALSASGKPVVAVMRSVGASGAFYLAVGCDHIVASPLTLTGSIGVIIPRVEFSVLLERLGIDFHPYKSGEWKDLLSGAVEREEDVQQQIDQHIQRIVDQSFYRFAEVVARGRDRYERPEDIIAAEFGDGRILSGRQAYELGLVDELGYFNAALQKAHELAAVAEVNVVRYRQPWRFRDVLPFRIQGRSEFNLLKVDTHHLWETGHSIYYAMPGLFH